MNGIRSLGRMMDIFVTTSWYVKRSQHPQSNVENLKQQWISWILSRLKVEVELIGKPCQEKSVLLVGNHIGYLDILVLFASNQNLSFVAKQEISRWPVFGKAAHRIDTVFVKRESNQSRNSARTAVVEGLKAGKQIVVFPAGTTSLNEHKDWRRGAFEIAKDQNCKVQPFRISYFPLRAVAYIDRDFFPVHLMNLLKARTIRARIEFHEPVSVTNPVEDSVRWQNWTKNLPEAHNEMRPSHSQQL